MQLPDQLGRTIMLEGMPQRIVSLVPSQTELLFALGLGDRVVGVTKFCIHPEEALVTKKKVGGTKKLDFDAIQQLNPDLIIGNKEENDQEQIERLMQKYPVWMSDISNLHEALEMIIAIGVLTGTKNKAILLANDIANAYTLLMFTKFYRTAYFIWRKPYMVAGGGTFIHDLMKRCGLINVFSDQSRYPEISDEDLIKADPEVILLSSEPYPFSEKHIAELQALCPAANILLVDGEMFSWYGNRLLPAKDYFEKLVGSLA